MKLLRSTEAARLESGLSPGPKEIKSLQPRTPTHQAQLSRIALGTNGARRRKRQRNGLALVKAIAHLIQGRPLGGPANFGEQITR